VARSVGTSTTSENPFSAHRILPGAIPYLFSHEDDSTDLDRLDRLIDAWQASGYFGQIVGAHGCGKTTLAHAIAKRTAEQGRQPFDSVTSLIIRSRSLIRPNSAPSWFARLLRLHSIDLTVGTAGEHFKTRFRGGRGSARAEEREEEARTEPHLPSSGMPAKNILVIDGIERLTLTQQALTLHTLKRQRVPTLLTTHRVSKRLRLVGGRFPVLFHAQSNIKVFIQIVNSMTQATQPIAPAAIEAAFEASGGNVREALMTLYDVFESNK